MRAAAAASGAGPYDQLEKKQLQVIVEQLQVNTFTYIVGNLSDGLTFGNKILNNFEKKILLNKILTWNTSIKYFMKKILYFRLDTKP